MLGIAVETGVVMVVYLDEALDHRLKSGVPVRNEDIEAAVIEGAVHGLRLKLMTVSVVLASLIPILWETGVGAYVMKPIAARIVGGILTSMVLVLILVPVFFALMKERALRRGNSQLDEPSDHCCGEDFVLALARVEKAGRQNKKNKGRKLMNARFLRKMIVALAVEVGFSSIAIQGQAQDTADTTLTGIVSDALCGAKHSMTNLSAADCTRMWAKSRQGFAQVVADRVYNLRGDSAELDKYAAPKVTLKGKLRASTVTVDSVARAK
jgi:hypothetical protein